VAASGPSQLHRTEARSARSRGELLCQTLNHLFALSGEGLPLRIHIDRNFIRLPEAGLD
jgi:hypothetical protein